MFSEAQIQELPSAIEYQLRKLNSETLERLGERIRAIGKLLPSDAHKLKQLKQYGADVDAIVFKLSELSSKSKNEIYRMFDLIAKDNVEFNERFYKASGVKYIPYSENKTLQRFVRAMAVQTAGEFLNASQTTGFMLYDSVLRKNVFTDLSRTYQRVIDKAIVAVSTGVSSYNTEMRATLKELADSGLRTPYKPSGEITYASGYSRRLDTAVRQNILWGLKQCSTSISEQVGQEFGADGYEVDYHANPRPTHAEMGGKQYAIGEGRTVDGVYYPPFSEAQVLLDDYNCLHFYYPVILGISNTAYSKEQLDRLKEQDRKTVDIDGKSYTGYEATQVQRKLETAIRNARDRLTIAKAAEDDILVGQERKRLNQLTYRYKEFSRKAGLSVKAERMRTVK
jgi:hypothetical protein